MKKINLIGLIFFLSLAFSEKSQALQVLCASPSGESLAFTTDKNNITVSYDAGRGPAYAPIEDGPVRQISMDYYSMAFKNLKNVLSGFALKWLPSQCHMQKDWWLSDCRGIAQMSSGALATDKIVATSVNLSRITEEGASGNQTIYRFRVVFNANGGIYFVPLSFPKQMCQVSN